MAKVEKNLAKNKTASKIIRVLMAKPGLDGHDRGAKVVARGLRDAGYEVIYTGLHQTPEMVVNAALQEDVDIIGLSILSGAHIPLVKAVQSQLKNLKLKKPIFVGGIIPEDDAKLLKKAGISAIFGPGTPMNEIASSVRDVVLGTNRTTKKAGSSRSIGGKSTSKGRIRK